MRWEELQRWRETSLPHGPEADSQVHLVQIVWRYARGDAIHGQWPFLPADFILSDLVLLRRKAKTGLGQPVKQASEHICHEFRRVGSRLV